MNDNSVKRAQILTLLEVFHRGQRVLTFEIGPDAQGLIDLPLAVALDGALIVQRTGEKFRTRIDRPWNVRWSSLS